ncbi:MAG: hypothetical protein NC898_03960 [Candidatus Omnitrophica bacterium]|nr:hypothetical protein [Candidatus Omnitrophota bacterium]MCM8793603.1 hypothetical protein [Candidatus Omnitrophota bacterium]
MKRVFSPILVLIFILPISSFAQTTGEIQRSEELLEKEKRLKERIERKENVFIKKIIVEGCRLLSEDEIKEIILPFQRKWLNKEEIKEILNLFKETYEKKNLSPPKISYQIKKHQLKIQIEE